MTDQEPVFIRSLEGLDLDDEEAVCEWAGATHAASLGVLDAIRNPEMADGQSTMDEGAVRAPTIEELVDAYDRGDITYDSLKKQLTGHPTGGLEYEDDERNQYVDVAPPLSADNPCWIYDSLRLSEKQVDELVALLDQGGPTTSE